MIALPPLPWATDALAPFISARTIDKHYGAHHRAYVDKTNALIAGTPYDDMDHAEIVRMAAGDQDARGIFNNAAQAFNHERYWESLAPDGGKPLGALGRQIADDFGDLESLNKLLVEKGEKHFASGWVSLVWNGAKLSVLDAHDAATPILEGLTPLITIDVWEHAYYLDVQNERPRYLKQTVASLLNWKGASQRFEKLG